MTQWRLEINNSEFAENLYDVEVTDAGRKKLEFQGFNKSTC